MKTKLFLGLSLLSLILPGVSGAAVTINPSTGWLGEFQWNGPGLIDSINWNPADTTWTVSVPSDVTMNMVTAHDAYVPGDEFALIFDSALTPWTNEYVDGSGYYHGEYSNLFLTAGTHSFSIMVTALAPGHSAGSAHAAFSAVPAPGAFLLTALGTGLAGFIRRRGTV